MIQRASATKAFTLIELLVVIAVIGVLVAIILPNLLGMRERARDTVKKNDLTQLKTALRLYYNDYNVYPNSSDGSICCNTPSEACVACVDDFSAAGVDYMAELPSFDYDYALTGLGGDNFLLSTQLENLSDSAAAQSANRCDVSLPVDGTFYQCAD